jgi:hypothetical protein
MAASNLPASCQARGVPARATSATQNIVSLLFFTFLPSFSSPD